MLTEAYQREFYLPCYVKNGCKVDDRFRNDQIEQVRNLECKKYDQILAGDHYIFIGEVIKSTLDNVNNSPLIYFGKAYRELK